MKLCSCNIPIPNKNFSVSAYNDILLLSSNDVYENIFNMSKHEWTTEQEQVIEDLKGEYRKEQIKSEGNDPGAINVTGMANR